jgi:hypothetical protein
MYQGLDEGKCSYQRRSPKSRVGIMEKSAEVIVLGGNESTESVKKRLEVSQSKEGLNTNWFTILDRMK